MALSCLYDARAMKSDQPNGETILDQEPPVGVCAGFAIVNPHNNLSGLFVGPSGKILNTFQITNFPNVMQDL